MIRLNTDRIWADKQPIPTLYTHNAFTKEYSSRFSGIVQPFCLAGWRPIYLKSDHPSFTSCTNTLCPDDPDDPRHSEFNVALGPDSHVSVERHCSRSSFWKSKTMKIYNRKLTILHSLGHRSDVQAYLC